MTNKQIKDELLMIRYHLNDCQIILDDALRQLKKANEKIFKLEDKLEIFETGD